MLTIPPPPHTHSHSGEASPEFTVPVSEEEEETAAIRTSSVPPLERPPSGENVNDVGGVSDDDDDEVAVETMDVRCRRIPLECRHAFPLAACC